MISLTYKSLGNINRLLYNSEIKKTTSLKEGAEINSKPQYVDNVEKCGHS